MVQEGPGTQGPRSICRRFHTGRVLSQGMTGLNVCFSKLILAAAPRERTRSQIVRVSTLGRRQMLGFELRKGQWGEKESARPRVSEGATAGTRGPKGLE